MAGERERQVIVEGPLLHLTANHIKAIDMQIHKIVSGFGYVTVKVAHGRIAAFDVLESVRVIDELSGLPPRGAKSAA